MKGYTGKILHIDMTDHSSHVEHVSADFLKKYIGGVSLAVRLTYDNTPKGTDALAPENALCLATSVFAATPVPVGTKHAVAAKSPLTNFIGDSLASSYFSASIRQAGYDAMVVKGKADKLTYLFIDDDDIEFRDAAGLKGMNTWETEEAIRAEIGDQAVRACTAGPAGENMVRFANITNDRGRQAGRGGLGAVMGSKHLKAIAIRGSRSIEIADLKGLQEMAFKLSEKAQGIKTEKYRNLGTVANVMALNRLGILPTRNFQEGVFEGAEQVSGEYLAQHHKEKAVACMGCPIACEQIMYVKDGEYKGARPSVDYESLFALGTCCGVDYAPGIIKAIETCDLLGMDTMSSGVVVAWAMECFERGILTKKDCDGLELRFGNHQAEVKLLEKIAQREGIGDLLAEGVKRASEKLGQGSEHFAMHCKGMEYSGYDPRGAQTFAVGSAVGTRGGCHNRSLSYEADTHGEVDRFTAEPKKGKLACEKENLAGIFDIVMLCKFIRGCLDDAWTQVPELFTLTTGMEMTADDLREITERSWNLKKAFNIREGWTKDDDWLPPRFMEDPIPAGTSEGYLVKADDLRVMIDAYYKARGWTPEGLIPKKKLVKLGLDDIAEELGV
jgi:aldehyde:ferredoxin oxidoreductase